MSRREVGLALLKQHLEVLQLLSYYSFQSQLFESESPFKILF